VPAPRSDLPSRQLRCPLPDLTRSWPRLPLPPPSLQPLKPSASPPPARSRSSSSPPAGSQTHSARWRRCRLVCCANTKARCAPRRTLRENACTPDPSAGRLWNEATSARAGLARSPGATVPGGQFCCRRGSVLLSQGVSFACCSTSPARVLESGFGLAAWFLPESLFRGFPRPSAEDVLPPASAGGRDTAGDRERLGGRGRPSKDSNSSVRMKSADAVLPPAPARGRDAPADRERLRVRRGLLPPRTLA
jgi:hypothetical protein